MEEEINFYFFCGKPGAGKDTQANILAEILPKVFKESTGDIFYSAKYKEGKYAHLHRILAPYIQLVDEKGGLIPDEPITDIVRNAVEGAINEGYRNFIFTGFPRTVRQLALVDEMLEAFRDNGFDTRSEFIEIKVTNETAVERSETRMRTAISRGERPKDVDLPEIRQKRLNVYLEQTRPMIDLLEQESRLMVIDGEPRIEIVTEIAFNRLGKERM